MEKSRAKASKALDRYNNSIGSLETFLGSMHVEHINASNLDSVVDAYNKTGERLDDQVATLEEEIEKLDSEILLERHHLSGPTIDDKLRIQASIGVFAGVAGKAHLVLVYGMHSLSLPF